jgi:hypothetical protein
MKTNKSTTPVVTNSAPGNCRIDPSRDRGFIRKRLLLAILLMGASLTVFLWGAGGISYGDSARSRPLKVTANAQFYPTFGTPNDALVTADNAYALVSVSRDELCTDESCAGVQVFAQPDFTNPCGGQRILNFPRPRPGGQPVRAVDGMQFFPGSPQVSVGAAVEAHGAEFFRLASLTAPCAMDGVINVQQYLVIPNCGASHCPPGTFDIAVTPDGHYAFVANEYGTMPSPTPPNLIGVGTIGVIRVERDDAGGFTRGTRSIEHNNTIYIPGGNTIPGITMSHDGRYLYVTCEGSAKGINPDTRNKYRDPTRVAQPRNGVKGVVLCPGCRSGIESCDNESNGDLVRNGLLAVIDVDKATKGMGQASIITIIAAGCSPVRAVETADGQYVWVAARGRNTQLPLPLDPDARGSQVLGFNRSALVSSSPNSAFVGYGDTHGTAPVGLGLFNNDTLLAVANSNRFWQTGSECKNPTPPPGVPPCTANVAIMDVSNPAEPTVIQTVPAFSNDSFPRNVTVGPDDSTLYVPNADAKMLEVITTGATSLGNISTRAFVQTGDNVMIGGFMVQGTEPKRVIIRAIGPELTQYGVPDALANPTLELHDGTGALIASNNNWASTIIGGIITANQVRDIQNSGHAPGDPLDSAIIADLPAGSYTAIVRGVNNTTGVALVEVYCLSPETNSILGNISARSFVQTGDNVMIGGFMVQGTEPKRVIIRAIGPELTQYGVPDALANPTLELHDGRGALIASNNNWASTIIGGIITANQVRDIQNSGHAPGDPLDSAIIADLPAGSYTAIVRGVNNTTGVALVEVYDLDQ